MLWRLVSAESGGMKDVVGAVVLETGVSDVWQVIWEETCGLEAR